MPATPTPPAPLPPNEAARLALLAECRILDTPAESDFDDLSRLAAQICETPIALISLVDGARQWFKSRVGLEVTETPRRIAFCAHCILEPGKMLIVPDATQDARFAGNELVTGEPGIRFYAGAPLVMEDGHALGSLCVIDLRPRELTAGQREALAILARQVVSRLQLRRQNFVLRQTEEKLLALSGLQRVILDSAAHAVIATTPEGIITQFNPAAERMLGYTAEEMIGRETPRIFHVMEEVVRHAEEVSAELGVALKPGFESLNAKTRRGLPNEGEWTFVRKDGSRFHAHLSITGLWDDSKNFTGCLGLFSDITERKRAEARLVESERRFREAVEYSAIGMALARLDGSWLKVNRALCAILGRTEEELYSVTFQEITHPADLDADLANVRALLAGEIAHYQMEKRFFHKRGEIIWVRLAVTLVRDADGQPVHFVKQLEDITGQRNAQQLMRNSLEEKETLLKEIHHRVKNNLQVISSLLQLQSDGLADPRLLSLFREAQDRVRAMALVHESLYRSGNLAAVNFGTHVEELAATLMRSYATGAAPVSLEARTQPVNLDIDVAVPLSLIVNELVTNAFKHSFGKGRGGVLRVVFHERENGEIFLSIGDDGPGLPADFQLENSTSLGLKVVRILTAQIDGRLNVERDNGTVFALTFPRTRKN